MSYRSNFAGRFPLLLLLMGFFEASPSKEEEEEDARRRRPPPPPQWRYQQRTVSSPRGGGPDIAPTLTGIMCVCVCIIASSAATPQRAREGACSVVGASERETRVFVSGDNNENDDDDDSMLLGALCYTHSETDSHFLRLLQLQVAEIRRLLILIPSLCQETRRLRYPPIAICP